MKSKEKEELLELVNKIELTEEQEKKLNEIIKLDFEDIKFEVKDGFKFLSELKEEAKHQKEKRFTEEIIKKAIGTDNITNEIHSTDFETDLADSFEIIEE